MSFSKLIELIEGEETFDRVKVAVKILKATSVNEFIVADTDRSCKMKIANLKPIHVNQVKERACVRIFNATFNKDDNTLVLDSETKIFKIKDFESFIPSSVGALPLAKPQPGVSGMKQNAGKKLSDIRMYPKKKVVKFEVVKNVLHI